MEATRTVTWSAKDGRKIEAKITLTREVADDVAYADGNNINLGKKTYESLEIVVNADGKSIASSHSTPAKISSSHRNYEKLTKAGAYASIGNAYITEENYHRVVSAVVEVETEVTGTEEFAEVRAQEDAREARKEASRKAEAKRYTESVKSGLCPKCRTWCYGDCQAS